MLRSWRLNLLLFLLTCVSTWWGHGLPYAATIMGILFFHEMGHYLQARRYRVPASLPYFLPLPLSIFGTMGAVIRMNNLGADRKVLFDIGVSGPIAGLVVAIPATIWGLSHSELVPLSAVPASSITLGDSLIFTAFVRATLGAVPEGVEVMLHPVAFAGWAGLFLTALNLLPIGQLDGGHVLYALLGEHAYAVAWAAMGGFILIAIFVNPVWTLMAFLVLLMKVRHPPTADDTVPLGPWRRGIGIAALIFFVLSFSPDPLRL